MKILLINSPVWLISGKSIAESPPLGLLYLASVLEKNKYQVKVIDADILKLDKQSLSHRIKLENPDIIGIGSTTLGLPALFKTVDICKKAQLRAKIITGGAGTSIEPENVLITNKNIDVAFINEAEESIINWLSVLKNGQSFKKVKGIAFLDNGKFFKTEAQLPPQNLDDIPFPAYHLLEPAHNDYHGVSGEWEGIDIPNAVIMGSRGCPHRCIFCSNKTRQPRRRSPKNIVDEIEFNKKNFNINSVQFYDNEFIGMTADQNQWVKLICKEIIDRKLNKLGYLIQGRCNKFVDLETLKMMRRAGFRWIWWGVESGSDKVLKIIKKDITVSEIKRAFKLAKQADLKSLMFIMVGFPGETKEDVMLSAKLVKEIKPDRAHFHIVTPLPGSELWDWAYKNGKIDEFDYSKYNMKSIITYHTDTLSRDEIKKLYEILLFRFSNGYWYFIKFFIKSLFSKDGIKKIPTRINKIYKHFSYLLNIYIDKL